MAIGLDLHQVYFQYFSEYPDGLKLKYYDETDDTNILKDSCSDTYTDSFEWAGEGYYVWKFDLITGTTYAGQSYQNVTWTLELYLYACETISSEIWFNPYNDVNSNYPLHQNIYSTWSDGYSDYSDTPSITTLIKEKYQINNKTEDTAEVLYKIQVSTSAPITSNLSNTLSIEWWLPLTGDFFQPSQYAPSIKLMWKLKVSAYKGGAI
jgi:hypothetical protein